MKDYDLKDDDEQTLHSLLNDTNVKATFLDLHEIVHELASINRFLNAFWTMQVDGGQFEAKLRVYKMNLIHHLEDI